MQSPQVQYHQGPNTPQGRGTPQRPGGPNAAYASHFSTPVAYNTQPGYNTVQNKPQPAAAAAIVQQPPQQQQQPPAVTVQPPKVAVQPAAVAMQSAAAPPPPPPPPPQQQPAPVVKMDAEDAGTNGASTAATPAASSGGVKPAWMKKGVKVNKVQKRRRQNARLRKMLVPKNALMAINEICPGPKFLVQEHTNALNQTIYSVRVEVDGKVHSGQSINKTHAKQMACENALKDILVTRMQTQNAQPASGPSGPGDCFSQDQEDAAADKDDTMSNDGSSRGGAKLPEDDMPWGCLASFALHKLFLEWQSQGVEIPLAAAQPVVRKMRAPMPHKSATPNSMIGVRKIPEDAHKKHPVLMLNHLQPGLQYSERVDGAMPNAVFVFSVNIEGQEFTGSGTTKKEAKKECAKAALVKFGIVSEY